MQDKVLPIRGESIRSFFSHLLLKNWAFLSVQILLGLIALYLEKVIPSDYHVMLLMAYFLFALFGTFYISFNIAKKVTDSLKLIERKASEINAGDFGIELTPPPIFELALLTKSLNEMAKRLQVQFIDLSLEKEKFNSLLQSLQEGVFAISREKIILFQNKSVHPGLIVPASQSRYIQDCIQHSEFLGFLNRQIELEGEGKIELEISGKYLNIRLYPLYSNHKAYIFLGVVIDTTEEKQNSIIREQFFQNASHELKTPITSIKGYAETLYNRLNPNDQSPDRKFLEAILRNSDRMVHIVEDMLTISKLESHKVLFTPEKFKLSEVVNSLSITMSSILSQKSQTFVSQIPESLEIVADQILFEHLLLNLISNACMYSSEGKSIVLNYLSDEATHTLQVIDEGIGIPESERERIFERFFRINENRSRKEGGTGLGLSIVKHICLLHEGSIRVIPNPNGGSIFEIQIPKKI